MEKVATIGMFDGVHRGHRFVLDYLKNRCTHSEKPLVFTFSNHPLEIINPSIAPKLLSTADEKIKLLEKEEVKPVILDFDNRLRSLSSLQFIEKIKNEYGVTQLILGFDNRFGNDIDKDFNYYKQAGKKFNIEIENIPEFFFENKKISSSIIRKLISDRKIKEANDLLGYNYKITGTVTKGKQIGRTIGFPTANIIIDNEIKLIPANGVYVADVTVPDGKQYRSIINIGHRPTVENNGTLKIETHLDGFSGNLYGQKLGISFLKYLREERRFMSLEDLKSQLHSDLSAAKTL